VEDYKDIFQMKLDELLEAGVPLEEAEMQALELMREALAGGYEHGRSCRNGSWWITK